MQHDDSESRGGPMPFARRSDSSEYVRSRWPFLPPHIREAIITLVDAGLSQQPRAEGKQEGFNHE